MRFTARAKKVIKELVKKTTRKRLRNIRAHIVGARVSVENTTSVAAPGVNMKSKLP